MNPDTVTVLGNTPFEYDYKKIASLSAIITSGSINKSSSFQYAVTNLENRIQDLLNTKVLNETRILTTSSLHKKYVFFERVDTLPDFPYLQGKSVTSLSDQLLSLLLGIWMEYKTIYLFGYDIEDLSEREHLISVVNNNPHTKIFYVRKPNPNKIFLFDTYENMSVIDYNDFEKLANGTE